MSSIPMTNEDRSRGLEKLGYTQREASFLCLAALHGGYFLRRQFCAFIGKEIGGSANALTEKLLIQGHGSSLLALNNTKIYHLSNRPFYALLGESDNRNRRKHAVPAMKRRLMCLDFVLANPQHSYLATELEKVCYFSETIGIPHSALPYKRYVSRKSPSTTTRYFVDKFPIFLAGGELSRTTSRVSFVFVDEGAVTLSAFETYLHQYADLWRGLPCFQVIYAADSRRLFAAAERKFASFAERLKSPGLDANAVLATRLLQHFKTRSLYETGDWNSLSREKLIQLRNETAEFSTAKYQDLYSRWKEHGAQALIQALALKSSLTVAPKHEFSTHFLNHSYGFFGTSGTLRTAVHERERPDTPRIARVSERLKPSLEGTGPK